MKDVSEARGCPGVTLCYRLVTLSRPAGFEDTVVFTLPYLLKPIYPSFCGWYRNGGGAPTRPPRIQVPAGQPLWLAKAMPRSAQKVILS